MSRYGHCRVRQAETTTFGMVLALSRRCDPPAAAAIIVYCRIDAEHDPRRRPRRSSNNKSAATLVPLIDAKSLTDAQL